MNKTLLIHNDNVPSFAFTKSIKFFSTNQSDIDSYISITILEKIREFEFDVIYIKDSLSQNYLDLYGLRVAHHIRLSCELGDKRFLPIVILSDIDSYMLNKLSKLSRILFTQNIYLLPNNKEDIQNLQNNIRQKEIKYPIFLETIDVEKPEQSSNHDIANEWAIYKWSEYLNVKSKSIEKNNQKIIHSLYFKTLRENYNHKKSVQKKFNKVFKQNGKILYIDDEWKNGWKDIIKQLLSNFSEVEFQCYEGSFENKIKLLFDIKNKVKESNPDIVLLDLRLTQTDHGQIETEEDYSGIKIIKIIKEFNPGIQTIMITATSQSTILERFYEYGILGYIKKEHPEDRLSSTEDNIEKLYRIINQGLNRQYLKEIWIIKQNILDFSIIKTKEDLQELTNTLEMVFDILNSDIVDKKIFTGLIIFKCIEIIIGFYIEEKSYAGVGRKRIYEKYWKGTDQKINVNSVEDKIRSIFNQKFKTNYKTISQNMKELVRFRNNTIHGGRVNAIEKPTAQNLITWFKMLQKIIAKMDETL